MAQAELESGTRLARARPPLRRSRRRRVLAGVAGGIAEHLGVGVVGVRVALVLLTFAGGFGVVVYLLLWLLAPLEAAGEPAPPSRRFAWPAGRQVLGAILLVGGVVLLLWVLGFWFGGHAWPAVLGAIGFAVIWGRSDDRFARWDLASVTSPVETLMSGRISLTRIAIGSVLILAGMGILLAATTSVTAATSVIVAVLVTIGGIALLAGPWIWNLGRQLIEERSSRIRSEARAEMAAHLHDSVLQTLALIQRSRQSREMATLARTQERELRAWLYGRAPTVTGAQLRDAIDAMAGRIERQHQVNIETVVVGDTALDERLDALIAAVAEATLNAARHSGVREISVYLEVEADVVTAFIRDQGRGFDRVAVPHDRRGIADSILGRMERIGGSAEVRSQVGVGTEVILRLPGIGS